MPLVGRRVLEAEPGFGGEPFRDAVNVARAEAVTRGRAIELLGASIGGRLASDGIAMLPLKGPFLARRLYGDPGARTTNDLDMLVAEERLEAAVAAIAQLGFEPDAEGSDELHRVLRHPRGLLPRIEVHWRVHWFEHDFSRAMLDRSLEGGDWREPEPADELAALLLFYARDGFYGLRAAADIGAWWDRHGDGIGDQPALAEHLARHSELRLALTASARVAERVAGPPAERLVGEWPPGRRVRLTDRLANWNQAGELDQLSANVALVDGLLTPRGQLGQFWRRHVWRSREDIARLYDLPERARLRTALLRLGHVPKQAFRFALGLLGYRGAGD